MIQKSQSNLASLFLRWLMFIPLYLLIQLLVVMINNGSFARIAGDIGYEITKGPGFGGHWIRGPFYLFYVYALAGGASLYGTAYLLFNDFPKQQKILSYIVLTLVIAMTTLLSVLYGPFGISFTVEERVRAILEGAALSVGTFIAFFEIQKNWNKVKMDLSRAK